jgi:hypothetical protein
MIGFAVLVAAGSVAYALGLPGLATSGPAGQRLQLDPCYKPAPADFGPLDESFADVGDEPWVFVRGPANRVMPVRATVDRLGQSIPIRLNDGSRASLRVENAPCAPPDECDPEPCFNPDESYWIEVSSSTGRRVAHLHFCGPYNEFHVAPVDLLGGRGDEILLIRARGHAAPPIGDEVKIWTLEDGRGRVVLPEQQVSGGFGTAPTNCARWRARLLIDLEQRKPRSLRLQTRFGARPGCQICDDATIAAVRHARLLRFDARRGQYDRFHVALVR